ncbi:MAG: hypothetical protein LAT55_00805 [Opitutales bacterium]|nr:hypothetical protein [Opitutales bacterium]
MNHADDSTIRFIAKSAQEAAAIVRERLGPEGRVISVEQIMGSGLKRFVSAPRLQIVAKKVPPPEFSSKTKTSASEQAGPEAPAPLPNPTTTRAGHRRTLSCRSLLLKAGFSSRLMARLEGAERWREIGEMEAGEGLPQAIAWLRQYRAKPEPLDENSTIAFIGFAGAGKTSALLKYLARELFLYNRTPKVLQMEVDKPHMDSGLSLYCDVLGVPCFEDPSQIKGTGALLIDVPGVPPSAKKEQANLAAALKAIGTEHRVLVMNAAYENPVLERHSELGLALGATHRVYTHLDELDNVSKLWVGVLDPKCPTLFFSNGQNMVGNLVEDSFGFLIERTFPR